MVYQEQPTWVAGQSPVHTICAIIKRRNSEYTGPAGDSAAVEQGISFLRSQHEETYKQLIAPVIAYFSNVLVLENDKNPVPRNIGAFNASSPPDVSIADYLARIVKYTPCSAECYILALIFIDRVAQNHRVHVNSYNIHRLLLTATLISAKLLDDTTYNNKYYSHVGGISVKELNFLECKMLALMNYDLNVSTYLFELYRYEVELQLIRQMHADSENSVYSADEMMKWEDNKSSNGTLTPEGHSLLRSKRLRRSRSFTNCTPETKNLFRRKNRSTSFTILGLVSPPAAAHP